MENGNRVDNQVPAEEVISVYKILLVGILFFCTCFVGIKAQYQPSNMPLIYGETVNYDVYFKWGILMPRAGQGCMSFYKSMYEGQSASKFQLIFQTSKFFDAIYKMRDTLYCFYDQEHSLLHSSKRVSEGGRYLIDDLTFSYSGNKTAIRSHRYTPSATKIDTVLNVTSGCVSDMLGAVFYLRTLDWNNMKIGDCYSLTVAIGRDLVEVGFRYQGQSIVERDDVKYRTRYFLVDIFDEAFEQSVSAAELWIGDDENRIPIKIRSKLKIGSAEIYYKSSSNLKVPLTCRVEMKKR